MTNETLSDLPEPWRRTFGSPVRYWLVGTAILWLTLPISLIDIFIDPTWHAPHWQCDSLGVAIGNTVFGLFPWAVFSAAIAALLSFPATWHRRGGADIFDWRLGKAPWNWILTILVVLVTLSVCHDIFNHLYTASIPQIITADCGGRSEPVTVVRRAPFLQFEPFWGLAFVLWLLHLRALALSPKTSTES